MLPPIVSADWLAAHRDEVAIADVRFYLDGRSGRAAYESGHIAGAIFVELETALADPPSPQRGRHPLPDPDRFAAALGALGIGDDNAVVAYDDAGGAMAARLVWMLRAIGAGAALLDGGLSSWDGPLENRPSSRPPVRRRPTPWPPERLASIEQVAAGAGPLLDARAPERYRGEHEPIDPRAGHIPGARNVPFQELLGPGNRFRGPAELRERFAQAGVASAGAPPVAYCGSGVTACQLLLALEAAELGRGRLYPGSWSQWSADPERPAGKAGH